MSVKPINYVTDGVIIDVQNAIDCLINVPVNYAAEKVKQETPLKPSRGRASETLTPNVQIGIIIIVTRTLNPTTHSQTDATISVGSKQQFYGV